MFKSYFLASVVGQDTSSPGNLLSSHRPERVARDQVKSRPVRDQYADLAKASERLDAGQSVVFQVQVQVQVKHHQPA